MQRLMILGGTHYIISVIQKAHELELYVITCDYLPGNIAHKYADEYCNVSVSDKDAVLAAATCSTLHTRDAAPTNPRH